MSGLKMIKTVDCRILLALPALAGASVAAYGAGGYLAYAGITYYIICAMALLKGYRKAALLLWLAFGFHTLLIGYALWDWRINGIIPCPYCFAAAGMVLLAATVLCRIRLAVLPLLLITGAWFAWPHTFTGEDLSRTKTGVEEAVQTASQPESQPDWSPTAGAGGNDSATRTGGIDKPDPAVAGEHEQTGIKPEKTTDPGPVQNPPPEVKQDGGTGIDTPPKPPDPVKPTPG